MKIDPPGLGTPRQGRMPTVQRVLRSPIFWIAAAAVAAAVVIVVLTMGGGGSGGGGVGY
jgi:hypothetical protein